MTAPPSLPEAEAPEPSDLMEFSDRPDVQDEAAVGVPWVILMVDDDQDVHDVTLMSVKSMRIEARRLHFLQAFSAREAREILKSRDDIAVILLDVVMESEDAGLQLVKEIRQDFGLATVQIILRTGQPGFAPEIETIQKYEINDYRSKTELTQVRLYTSLTSAIRTYAHLQAMQDTRRGLEVVVHASTELSQIRGLQKFSEGLFIQLCALLKIRPNGLVCARMDGQQGDEATVIVACGVHAPLLNRRLSELDENAISSAIRRSLKLRANIVDSSTTLYFPAPNGQALVAFTDAGSLNELDRHLIQAFCSSMTVGLENVLLHQRMFSLAYQDQLLGVANRNRLLDLLQARMDGGADLTVAVIDLDDFAGDNAMFGHAFGDELLKAFAHRLADCAGPTVDLARLSGDIFALVGSDAQVNPQTLAGCNSALLKVQNQMVTVSATCGLVRLHADNRNSAELLKQAHVALKLAKSQHRGACMYYSKVMGTDATERSTLLRSLRDAFESDRLYVVYQPQVRLSDGATIGAEALLRWRAEDGRYVPPDQFIPLAEQSGLMISIGEFVLRTACHQLRQLHDAGFHGFRMSVNVSQAQFREPGFVETVIRALADSGAPVTQLELEITESMAAEAMHFVLGVLHELKSAGVTIAIDDFGTGYSSLSILGQLPLDRLKIDKSFVNDLGVTESVAKSIIDIGHSLKLELIAEGVETELQARKLLELGCAEGQGYLYARPLPAVELLTWLQMH